MLRKLALVVVCLAVPAAALAHLCNDVFQQAADNLAVKVDVRDGQLRIGETASFRVYLLNTMDRDIEGIALAVTAEQFTAEVKPSPDWKTYPALRTCAKWRKSVKGDGKKEYFEVTLKRKAGVPDGKYQIGLALFEPGKKERVFRTVSLDDAAGVCELPKAAGIKVDGEAPEAEWGKSALCTDFTVYVKVNKLGKFAAFESQSAKEQPRFRLAADAENLYCLLQFPAGAEAVGDEVGLYAAASADAKPVVLTFDRLTAKASGEKGVEGVEVKAGADKTFLECKVPRELLGLKDAKTFYINFTRTVTAKDADGKEQIGRAHV
jgi:hypothetical protein